MKYPIQKFKALKNRKRRQRRVRKPIPRLVVPSFFTLMNLFCGFLSVITVASGNLVMGAWFIVLAGLFDSLDGVVARMANATSPFGSELDSLSDVVSFGVAPGFLVYNYAMIEFSILGIMLSALPPLCGAVRLARFNVDVRQDLQFEDFRGLPIPVQAIMLCAFVLTFSQRPELFSAFEFGVSTILTPVIVLLSFLMLSSIPFDKLPAFSKESLHRNKRKFLLFLIYLGSIILFREYGLIAVFSIYILKGLVRGGWLFWNEQLADETDPSSRDRYSEGDADR
ncbi:MAG: CDP-diacylglycerol--serine O-phosphatidyltransferase [Balneolaceae bacterium]